MSTHKTQREPLTVVNFVTVLVALLVLMLLSAGSAFLPMGVFNTVTGVGIAVIKASLVLIFFMQLRRHNVLLRLAAAAGFIWLAILVVIALLDYSSRINIPAPWG